MDVKKSIAFESYGINLIMNESESPTAVLIIAHGAGASMTHDFLNKLAFAFQEKDITVVRFNFPYMDAGKKFPGSPKINVSAWRTVVEWVSGYYDLPIFISGKSYGGRMASHLVAENSGLDIEGLIYFGFPLHAPGKKSTDRANHLQSVSIPQLFLQGTNDALADLALMNSLVHTLDKSELILFDGADHSFKTKGRKLQETITEISEKTLVWMQSIKE